MAYMMKAGGVDVRGRFIIDPDGVVQGFEVLTPPVGSNVAETLRQIQAFQLVRESKGAQGHPKRLEARQGRAATRRGPGG
jgi:alkyl hydroperoxide reductase subunit AhpC